MWEIWAFLTGQHVVYLEDFDGEVTKTVARKTPRGYVAKRYWPFNIHNVMLRPDGGVEGSAGEYVETWRGA